MTDPASRLSLACLAAIAAISFTGCASTAFFSRTPSKADPRNPAVEMVCLWQPAKGPGLNGVPSRGFAGQIMFFTRGQPSPVLVDGDIRIYEFDNLGTAEEQAKPLHQFDFRAEDWSNFARQGTLGPVYSIFIPYVRQSQDQVECTLQVRFKPKDGPMLYSDMTGVTLPGRIDTEPRLPESASTPAAAAQSGPAALKSGLSVHAIPTQAPGQHPLQPAGRLASASPEQPMPHSMQIPNDETVDGDSGIVQTSYEVPAPAGNARSAHSAMLEQKMQKILQENEALRRQVASPAARGIHPLDTMPAQPAEIHEDSTTETPRSRRFRLTAASARQPAEEHVEEAQPMEAHARRAHPLAMPAMESAESPRGELQPASRASSTPTRPSAPNRSVSDSFPDDDSGWMRLDVARPGYGEEIEDGFQAASDVGMEIGEMPLTATNP